MIINWHKGNRPKKDGEYLVTIQHQGCSPYLDVFEFTTNLKRRCGGEFPRKAGWYDLDFGYGDYHVVFGDYIIAWAEVEPYKEENT